MADNYNNLITQLDYKDPDINILKQLTIYAYYVNRPIGQKIYSLLWIHFGVHLTENIDWYMDTLHLPSFNLAPLSIKDENYFPCNPSIVTLQKGYLINIRNVNYIQQNAIDYHVTTTNGIVNTKNVIVYIDDKFNCIDKCFLYESDYRKKYYSNVVGMEDVRLFWKNDNYLAGTCTVLDSFPEKVVQIGYFETDICRDDVCLKKEIYVDVKVLNSPINSGCEKNWLPFLYKDMFFCVYDYAPFRLVSFSNDFKETKLLTFNDNNKHQFRGSAGPLLYKDGYLLLVHNHLWEIGVGRGRNYMHRFLYLDKEFNLVECTDWFYFKHPGIEFAASMCFSFDNSDILIGYGSEDYEAFILKLSVEKLAEMLYSPRIFLEK